jgi:hypothetical protein
VRPLQKYLPNKVTINIIHSTQIHFHHRREKIKLTIFQNQDKQTLFNPFQKRQSLEVILAQKILLNNYHLNINLETKLKEEKNYFNFKKVKIWIKHQI